MKERLDNLLVKKGIFQTRQKAQFAIENKNVKVNNIIIEKSSKQIEENSKIEIIGEIMPYVSKGGLKLEKAINVFNINLKNKVCIDIGASTGGFTDCMLQNEATKVYAIDVGHNQLDEKIKNNKNVINLEGTNIKDINEKEFEKADFISIDVSFISLTNVLSYAKKLLKQDGEMVILIKPQFEVGQELINKNGIVKNPIAHKKAIEKVANYAIELGLEIINLDYSPIKGSAGNIEYIAYLRNSNKIQDTYNLKLKIKTVVENSHKELK